MKSDDAAPPILAADDDENDLLLFRRRLLAAGIKNPIVTFSDGGGLLDFLRASCLVSATVQALHPCLLFLDLKMPKIDGFDVLGWIRRQTALKTMMIVMLSGSDEPADRQRAAELGADRYLVKFPPSEVLTEVVRNACGMLAVLPR